jgi:hypothetical protein
MWTSSCRRPSTPTSATRTALVIAASGARPTREERVAFARTRLAGYKLPRTIAFVDEFPRTPTGKVRKRELRDAYAPTPGICRRPRHDPRAHQPAGARSLQARSIATDLALGLIPCRI